MSVDLDTSSGPSVGTKSSPIRVKLQTADEHTYKAVMKVDTFILYSVIVSPHTVDCYHYAWSPVPNALLFIGQKAWSKSVMVCEFFYHIYLICIP